MKILTVSDEVVHSIHQPSIRSRFSDVRMILGCGDLPPSYLEYFVSTLNVACFYVPGNHDDRPEETSYGETVHEPCGCINIDGRVVQHEGLTIAGLGGSLWYNGRKHQYTQRQMWARVMLLLPRLLLRQRRAGHRLDFLITHAPAFGIHDGPNAHQGFEALTYLLRAVEPRYHIHGHVHPSYRYNGTLESDVGSTKVINTTGYRLLEVEPVVAMQADWERAVG